MASKKLPIKRLIGAVKNGNARLVRETINRLLGNKVQVRLAEKQKELSKVIFKEQTINEDVLETLKTIADKKSKASVKFDDGTSTTVDALSAQAILAVFNRMSNPEMKKKLQRMVNASPNQFLKVVDFAFKHTKLG